MPIHSGRVLRAHSGQYAVLNERGEVVPCRARRRLRRPDDTWPAFPVAGDLVEWRLQKTPGNGPTGVIEAVRPRQSEISRTRQSGKHVVVANLDQLIVVVAVRNPTLDRGLLDRLLATAEHSGIPAHVCLHKVDLAEPGEFDSVRTIYQNAGYPVLYTSAQTGEGLDELREVLKNRVSAFMGASGAGKSRLISRLQPGLQLRTGMVSAKTGQGRHTTTRVDLHPTDFGALLADTPGIREFSLWHLPPGDLRDLFPEFRERQEHCRFAQCVHDHEPACEVKSAVESGALDEGRYRSYLAILEDLRQQEREQAAGRSGRRRREDSR